MDSNDFKNNRGIVISNYISLLLCFAVSIVFTIKYFFVEYNPYGLSTYFYLAGIILFIIPILLNLLSRTIAARMILCLGSIVYVWCFFIDRMMVIPIVETTLYDGLRIYLLALSIIPFLIFNSRNYPVQLFFVFAVTLSSFIFFEEILGLAGVNNAQRGFSEKDYSFMQTRTFVAYLVIAGECFFFQRVLNQSDDFNQKIQSDLQLKSAESKARNTSLVFEQKKLHKANEHLEELVKKKTYEIELQNDKLRHYAYMNSYEIRKPVGNLVHLIEQTKQGQDMDYPELFDDIKSRTNEVEKIISQISKELNDIDYHGI